MDGKEFDYTLKFVNWTEKYINTEGANLNRAKSFLLKDKMGCENLLEAVKDVAPGMAEDVKGDLAKIDRAIYLIDRKLLTMVDTDLLPMSNHQLNTAGTKAEDAIKVLKMGAVSPADKYFVDNIKILERLIEDINIIKLNRTYDKGVK